MKKLIQVLLLALVVAVPAAIVAPQAQAKTASHQQLATKSSTKAKKYHHTNSVGRNTHRNRMKTSLAK